jgi:hypothetical protein
MGQNVRRWHAGRAQLALVLGLVALDVVARLLPHAPNFTPIVASGLFAGAFLNSRLLALTVPLAAMALSDYIIGFYDWHVMIAVYAAFMMPAVFGGGMRLRSAKIVALPLAVSSSVIFFVVSNFAVWAFTGMYVHDASGLLTCYLAALPFFQNALMGDAFWTVVLFGGAWMWQLARTPVEGFAGAR